MSKQAANTIDSRVSDLAVEQYDHATPEEKRRVLRKIDTFILPVMCLVFFLQYLDKQSLSYAAVFGVIQDLELTPVQYSWCGSIFYVGQLVAEYPFIYFMSRFKLNKLVGVSIIVWGAICMCLAIPHNFAGFAAVRFLLGAAEGAVSPAFVSITSIWYEKENHATRIALWITMNGVAQIIGCFLMYGIGLNTQMSIASWRVMFLVCGALTVAAGILFFFVMPAGPKDAWFLSPREKEVLSQRMVAARDGGDKTSFSTAQLRETLLDVRAWLTFAFGVLVTMQSPVLAFASLVINGIGYNKYQTMLYTAPSGAVQILLLWVGVLACWFFPKQRTLVAMTLCIPPLIGCVLLLKLPLTAGWGVIVASWLASCITAVMSPLLSLTASNVKGNTKRSTVNVMFFIGYCAGCIASPQLWTNRPRYLEGVITAIVTWCLLFVAVGLYRFICLRENKRREDLDDVTYTTEVKLGDNGAADADMTDKQDMRFRYST